MRRARHYCALSRGPTRGFSIGIVETGYIGVLREPHACHAQHLAGCDSCAARFDAPKRGSRAVLGYDELTDPHWCPESCSTAPPLHLHGKVEWGQGGGRVAVLKNDMGPGLRGVARSRWYTRYTRTAARSIASLLALTLVVASFLLSCPASFTSPLYSLDTRCPTHVFGAFAPSGGFDARAVVLPPPPLPTRPCVDICAPHGRRRRAGQHSSHHARCTPSRTSQRGSRTVHCLFVHAACGASLNGRVLPFWRAATYGITHTTATRATVSHIHRIMPSERCVCLHPWTLGARCHAMVVGFDLCGAGPTGAIQPQPPWGRRPSRQFMRRQYF